MRRMLCVLLGALVLTGCGKTDTAVPDEVRQMMNAEFPADGRIHVQSRGKFDIKPTTMFCRLPDSLMIDDRALAGLLTSLGQPTTLPSGYPRGNGKIGLDPECENSDTIFTFGSSTQNRNDAPYHLMLAVWQGDPKRNGAIWVGGIERTGGVRPDANLDTLPIGDDLGILGPSRDEQRRKARTESSIALDFSDISISFTKTVKGK